MRDDVFDVTGKLPERQRLALLLNKFHGQSYEELAATLEMTIPGVKSLLVRARENVRSELKVKDGTPVVQYDTRHRTRKVICFLHPALERAAGYIPIIAPVGVDEHGVSHNVNADEAAIWSSWFLDAADGGGASA